jgi:hypothetical protein
VSTKHTPGPWRYDKSHNAHPGAHRVLGPDGEVLADFGWIQRFDEAKANARLIAAAPELLETLRHLHTWLICPDTTTSAITAMRNMAAAAIAKAEGTGLSGEKHPGGYFENA